MANANDTLPATTTHINKFGERLHGCKDNASAVQLMTATLNSIDLYAQSLERKGELQVKFEKATDSDIKEALSEKLARMTGSDDTARVNTHEMWNRLGNRVNGHIKEMTDAKRFQQMNKEQLRTEYHNAKLLFDTFSHLFPVTDGK